MITKLALSLGIAIASVALPALSSAATAAPLLLKVYPSNTLESPGACPKEVTLNEQGRPYTEGSYTKDGSASLSWLAEKFKIDQNDEFSVTWTAKLQRKYSNCQGTAGIADNEGHSYLRMRFTKGNVYLILDMTGMYDANGLTPSIVNQGIRNGNPVWSWAGTD